MVRVRIAFLMVHQDSQSMGSSNPNEDHMRARIVFQLFDGKQVHDMLVSVRQPYGTKEHDTDFEVDAPQGSYRGSFNDAFRDACETFYRREIGSSGSAFRIEGCTDVHMEGNISIPEPMIVELDLPDGGGSTW